MSPAEKHIRHYNRLNGNSITKTQLVRFHDAIKKDIDSKRIDSHMLFGVECLSVESRLSSAIKKMNAANATFVERLEVKVIDVDKILAAQKKKLATEADNKRKDVRTPAGWRTDKKLSEKPMNPAPVGSTGSGQKTKSSGTNKKATAITKPTTIDGFTTADQAPEKPSNVFRFGGPVGEWLQDQQRFRCQIIIDGQKHSSKSELAKQIADGAIDVGFKTALIDWEQGGTVSKDTLASINRNLKPANKAKLHVSDENFPTTFEALERIAPKFDVIIIDSGSKINEHTNEWLDLLRTRHPKTIWVVLMQQNSKGGTRGGTAAGYNAPVVIKTYRPDSTDQLKNYAELDKNRGNKTDCRYIIAHRKIMNQNRPVMAEY